MQDYFSLFSVLIVQVIIQEKHISSPYKQTASTLFQLQTVLLRVFSFSLVHYEAFKTSYGCKIYYYFKYK